MPASITADLALDAPNFLDPQRDASAPPGLGAQTSPSPWSQPLGAPILPPPAHAAQPGAPEFPLGHDLDNRARADTSKKKSNRQPPSGGDNDPGSSGSSSDAEYESSSSLTIVQESTKLDRKAWRLSDVKPRKTFKPFTCVSADYNVCQQQIADIAKISSKDGERSLNELQSATSQSP